MKIGMLCPYDMYRFGGVQEQIKLHRDELINRGHEVKVIAPTTLIDDAKKQDYIIELGRSTKAKLNKTDFELSVSAEPSEIDDILESEQFDVLHSHEPFVPLMSRQVISRTKCPVVATFHAKQPETLSGKSVGMLASPYGKSILDSINRIVAASPVATAIIDKMTDRPIEVIPNTLDLSIWNRDAVDFYKDFDDGMSTILYIGRLEKRKGPYYLIKAYQELIESTKEHVRLLIASDGPDREKLEDYCKQNELHDVHFLGFISDEDKKSLLKTASVACFPALYGECFGIVLIEAMAMGTPVIAGDNEGYASVMKGQGALSLVSPKSTDDFARRLRLMIEQEPLRNLHLKWQNQAIKKYDVSIAVEAYEKIYKELTDG